MDKDAISDWDVPQPALRLWLTLALGALGAALFPGKEEWLPNPFATTYAAAGASWITLALAGVLLLGFAEKEKVRWRRPRLIDLERAPAIALAAPLLLFAARPAPGGGPCSFRQALTRAAFAVFPYAVAAGFTLTLLGFEYHRYFPRLGLRWLSFSIWTWLGCAMLFLLSPWPEYPSLTRRGDSKADRLVRGLGRAVLIAMGLLALLLWLRRFSLDYLIIHLFGNPLLALPCIGGGLLFLLAPWPAFTHFPNLGDFPEERKIPALGTIILMTIALLPFTSFAIKPFLYVASGKLFASQFDLVFAGALDQPSIGKGLFLFTYFSLLLTPYVAIVRWLSDRRTRLGYWAFADATIVLGLFMLSMLTCPCYELILYIDAMGITPRRLYGLAYCLMGYVAILGFLVWAIWPPKDDEDPKPA